MLSVVTLCKDSEKTDQFTKKLISSIDNSIWWGMHTWQSTYEASGFIDSIRDNSNSYQHWIDVINSKHLVELIVNDEI